MLIDRIDEIYRQQIGPDTATYHGSQNRREFGECIDHLDRCIGRLAGSEIWFLEIGAYKGLWALALSELCRHNGKTPRYVTVTWLEHDPNNKDLLVTQQYYASNHLDFHLIDADSTKAATLKRVLAIHPRFDIVFIDGDHAFKSVLADIGHYGPLATERIIFHDINTRSCGVRKAVEKAGLFLHLQIAYGDVMGIGIHDVTAGTRVAPKRRFAFF